MGWIIAAAIILLILVLKISVRVRFIDDMAMTLGVGIFKIKLYPGRQKSLKLSDYKIKKFRKNQEKAHKKQEAAKLKKDSKKAKKQVKEISDNSSHDRPKRDIMGLLSKLTAVTKTFLSRFGHHLRIDMKRLVIIIATGDAAKTAVLYGTVCASISCLLEVLDNCMHLKIPKDDAFYENIAVRADFLSEKIKTEVDITFSFRLWQLFDILFASGLEYIKKA